MEKYIYNVVVICLLLFVCCYCCLLFGIRFLKDCWILPD